MDVRVGLLVLYVLGNSWASGARQLATSGTTTVVSVLSEMQINHLEPGRESQALEEVDRNDKVCTLCEEYTAQALHYLKENKTQTEIIDILHNSCSQLASFSQQCFTLVDYYTPLFFSKISSIQPEDFCQKVNLCHQIAIISRAVHPDSCEVCHHAVDEMLLKLKDPDTQLEIIEILLKGCESMEKYMKKCKKLVFEFGPLILTNAEQFLETTDICTALHACQSPTASIKHVSSLLTGSMLSDS